MKKTIEVREDGIVVWSKEFEIGTTQPNPAPAPTPNPVPAPAPSPGGGAYSQQVKQAIRLSAKAYPGSNAWGFYRNLNTLEGSEVAINPNVTLWFLIDPKSVVGTVPNIRVQFTDAYQRDNLSLMIYTIDPSDNLYPGVINPQAISLSANTFGPWSPRGGHKDDKRYLIKVTETKGQSITWNIYWML